jgi:hypothetical protein
MGELFLLISPLNAMKILNSILVAMALNPTCIQ